MCPASRATASSAARGSTSGSATSGMGTIEPSGFRTVIPPSHASRAASRPTCSSSPSSKMGPIVAPLAPPTALSCCVRGDSTSDVTKIYTKTGDAGQTGLLGGARVPKSDARVEAYGDVDELSSALGLARARAPSVEGAAIERLEQTMDRWEGELPKLERFILPAGTRGAAALHVARTVCRRAERHSTAVPGGAPPVALAYLNRLSDLLFVAARVANARAGRADES